MPTSLEAAGWEFLAVFGSAFSALKASKDGEDQRLAALLWKQMPMAKALVDLALENPNTFQVLLDKHAAETMPFGEPPVTPSADGWSLRTYSTAQDGPSAQLQGACNALHDGESYFSNVMALGSYAALNMATGEERVQVAVAAKINRDKPLALAALVERLRQVVTDLETVVQTTKQPAS